MSMPSSARPHPALGGVRLRPLAGLSIDVRDFILRNYTPYEGDASFLAGPTKRTRRVWQTLVDMFPRERDLGVYDVDNKTVSRIDAFDRATSARMTPSSSASRPMRRSSAR